MADDKLKTGPEPPGPDRPGDAPAKEAPPIQEPPVQETDAPGKTQEPAAPGTGPALQAEQSVIPGMGEDNPARSALGEVVVDFDKINELMSQRRAAAHGAVDKLKAPATDKDGKEAPIPEEKAPEADQPKKRRGRPPKEQAAVSAGKKEKAAEPRTGRPSCLRGKRRKRRSPAQAARLRLTRRPVRRPRPLFGTKCPEVRNLTRARKRVPAVRLRLTCV